MENDFSGGHEVLHVVGGVSHLGGVMAFVMNLARSPIPGVRQSVWKHRECLPFPDSAVTLTCEGAARRTDVSTLRDVIGGARDLPPLRSWVRRHPNALLYAHSRMGMITAALTARLTGAPLLIHIHARASRPSLYRRAWRSSRATVLFNSRQTCRHYGCDPRTCEIVMPPIRWPPADHCDGPRPPSTARFVAAGMFVPWKNIHIIVEGFKELNGGESRAELCLFGNSPELASDYQCRIAKSVEGHSSIRLMGWNPDWTAELAPTDVFVHAAREEPFGIVMLEAFARGCRLVVPPDTFLDDLSAPLSTLGIERAERPEAGAYRQAMARALDIKPPSGGFWEARKNVSGQFSAEDINGRLAALYREIAGEGRMR